MDHKVQSRPCNAENCKDAALTLSESCWAHTKDKKAYAARISDVALKERDLKGFNLKRVALSGSSLLGVNFADADLSLADLSGSHLYDSCFKNSNLVGTNFSNCDLTNSDFKNAELTKADLSNTRLWNGDFMEANLSEANLYNADLWNASFFNTKFWHTNFVQSKFLTKNSFSRVKGGFLFFDDSKINEAGLFSAEESYRDIKNCFLFNGMYNDASWASFKEKAMERLLLKKKRSAGYLISLLMSLLCGYGERPARVIMSAFLTITAFSVVYYFTGAIESSVYIGEDMSFVDYFYYSAITFTTVGYGDFLPRPFALFRMLAAAEAFIGTFLTGLFIFTLARRYSAR
ncbi:pentapeptide repeat-containing protein [Candidatus Omnitrophota bacterium]